MSQGLARFVLSAGVGLLSTTIATLPAIANTFSYLAEQLVSYGFAVAVVELPGTSAQFRQAEFSQIQIPTLMISGVEDSFTPAVPAQTIPFTWLTTPAKHLVVMSCSTHFSCLGGGKGGGVLPVPEQLMGPDPELAHPAVKAVSVAFFKLYLTQQMDYQPYLTPAYVSSISPSPFQWSVVRSLKLPPEFTTAFTVSIPLQPLKPS
jgi:predicted dienelactone hydrolase